MTDGDIFPDQHDTDEDLFFVDLSDEALERIAVGNGAAAYTGFYGPWSPCTSIGLPCG